MSKRPSAQPEYQLTLRAMPNWEAPPEVRLKRLLKAALRSFGFRATVVQEATSQAAGPPQEPDRPAG